MMMRLSYRILLVVLLTCVFSAGQAQMATNDTKSDRKYPITCKNQLGPAPQNMFMIKEDVNSDGLIDLIADYPWGGSALYLNCGDGRYYRAIQSSVRIQVEEREKGWANFSLKKDGWVPFSEKIAGLELDEAVFVLIDGRLYRPDKLTLFEGREGDEEDDSLILVGFDGKGYSLPYCYSKKLQISAPRYQFGPGMRIEQNRLQKVDNLWIEFDYGKFQINIDELNGDAFQGVYFTELNHDGALDAVLFYSEWFNYGVGEPYAALLLNGGDNGFVLSGIVALGPSDLIESKPPYQFQTQEITISGKNFTAIVYKPPFEIRPWEKTLKLQLTPPKHYELYIYHPILKEFIHIKALPGDASSSFVPLDLKKFEGIFYHPLLRANLGSDVTKADESAISTLIENYEKSLVNAVNTNNFSLVEKYLTPGSNLYKSQKSLVAKLYQKKTQEKFMGYKVEKAKATEQANTYQVYVTEKIGIKKADKADFAVSKFRWIYTANFDGNKYSLSDIAKWDGK